MNEFLYYLNVKQFLATAATLALVVPAANAETYWLLIGAARITSGEAAVSMEKIEMQSIASCEIQGEALKKSRNFRVGVFDSINYACIVGK